MFLRLALVVVLVAGFLTPMAVQPKPASAAIVAALDKDVYVEVGTSVNQSAAPAALLTAPATQGTVQRVVAGPNRAIPTITVNVGDTVTFKPTRGTATAINDVGLTTAVATTSSGQRLLTFADTYPSLALLAGNGDFNSGAGISVTLNAAPVTTVPATPTVGTGATGDAGVGKFFPVSFKVPPIARKTASSPAVLKFSDGATDVTVNMVVNPKLQFTPDKAAKGKTITVSGAGFRGTSSIDLEVRSGISLTQGTGAAAITGGFPQILGFPFDGDATVTNSVQVTTLGTFLFNAPVIGTYTVTLPAGMTGTATGDGVGANQSTATVTGSPLALAAGANLVVVTAVGTVELTAATLIGTLTIDPPATFPSLKVSVGTISTDANGSFTGTFAAPELMGTGVPANTINARDGGNALANATELSKDIRTFLMDPSMTVTPASGAGGSTVTVEGSEFTVSTAVTVLTIGGVAAAIPVGTASDLNGKVAAFSTTLPLNLTAGKKSVVMTAGTSAAGSFTVSSAPLSLTPSTGAMGQEVVVGLKNMAASTAVAASTGISVGGALATHSGFTTDSTGNASVTVRVPTTITTVGAQDVIATVGATTATGTFTLNKPKITLTPTEQVRTGSVTVQGTGWVPDKNVTVNIGTPVVTTVNAVPDAAGNFTVVFTVSTDLAPDSTNNVVSTDTQGNTADTATLKVPAAGITVTPTKVGWGETITIKGTGFSGGSQVQYGFPWAGVGALTGFSPAVFTDSAGNFTASFVVPTVTKGVRSIGANTGGAAGVSATTTIEVSEAAKTTAAALAPIATQLVRVWGFDAATQSWKLYDPSVPAELNSLPVLNKGGGYFINVKAATTIVTGGVTINLSPGWNLVGWLD